MVGGMSFDFNTVLYLTQITKPEQTKRFYCCRSLPNGQPELRNWGMNNNTFTHNCLYINKLRYNIINIANQSKL